MPVVREKIVFSTFENCGDKKSSQHQQMLLALSIVLSQRSYIPEVPFLGKEPVSNRRYGAGENSEAEHRPFPLGSNLAALSQSDIFYRLSDKIYGNCSGNYKSPNWQCPKHLGYGHSLFLKTSWGFLTMPANQYFVSAVCAFWSSWTQLHKQTDGKGNQMNCEPSILC